VPYFIPKKEKPTARVFLTVGSKLLELDLNLSANQVPSPENTRACAHTSATAATTGVLAVDHGEHSTCDVGHGQLVPGISAASQ
jgi:hypothetical protein